jgi:hypothetical protein
LSYFKKSLMAGGMVQVVEGLPSKHKS